MFTQKYIQDTLTSNDVKQSTKDMLQYYLHKENVMTLSPFFKRLGVDFSKLNFRDKWSVRSTVLPNGADAFSEQWRGIVDSVADLIEAREEFKRRGKGQYGLYSLLYKAKNQNQYSEVGDKTHWWMYDLKNNIRPNLEWSLECGVGGEGPLEGKPYMRLQAEVHTDANGKIDKRYHHDNGTTHHISIPVPLMWHRHLLQIGQSVVNNKIVLSVRPLGMHGDVEGFAAKVASKGLRAWDWKVEDVYLGKFLDTVQICKSRLHIQSVAKRKASSEFTDEMLASFD